MRLLLTIAIARCEGGSDSDIPLEPHEFRAMADAIRVAAQAVGVNEV